MVYRSSLHFVLITPHPNVLQNQGKYITHPFLQVLYSTQSLLSLLIGCCMSLIILKTNTYSTQHSNINVYIVKILYLPKYYKSNLSQKHDRGKHNMKIKILVKACINHSIPLIFMSILLILLPFQSGHAMAYPTDGDW